MVSSRTPISARLARAVRSAAAALFLGLAAGTLAAATPADDAPQTQALVEGLLAITPLLPQHALILELKRLAADPRYPVRAREQALAQYALRLRDYEPDPAAWGALEFLSAYREHWLMPHPEAEAFEVPEFHVAAAARGTLNLWLRTSARHVTERDLAAGRVNFLDRAGGHAHRQQTAGILDALEAVEPALLEPARGALLQHSRVRPELAPVALAVGRLTGEVALIERVIEQVPALRFKAIYELERHLGAAPAQRRWLTWAAGENPELAAAAITALAERGSPGNDLFELLLARLPDPNVGVAAAHALGRLKHPAGIPRLAGMLGSTDPLIAARAALALKLNGSPAALAALRASPLAGVRQWQR